MACGAFIVFMSETVLHGSCLIAAAVSPLLSVTFVSQSAGLHVNSDFS